MRAIIELTGEAGTGKTTLATTLGEELTPASLLFIDASPDQKLTLTLCAQPPAITLGRMFGQSTEGSPGTGVTGNREAIDWAFSDLTQPAGEDHDLLTVGPLTDKLDIAGREKLRYGLTRLIEAYDYVIVDGYHPVIHALLPDESIRTLMVLTPAQMPQWQAPGPEGRTPSLILNRYHDEPLPARLENALLQGEVRMIGKLPEYPTPEDCIRRLGDDFRNCLLRLNIPLNLTHS